ncbi:BURP domain protein RD22-like isoform X2 [Prosopis cineraria]|uniref:BURP domain protein RD22-like isoform X2 n=1 Tax=Prosopis cineraria TaxID=364024 RepID=UPI0024103551|nr:BURP domain protein RD22-like isoform X2 [Prosopis cineraria]
MKFSLPAIVVFLIAIFQVSVVTTHAALPPALYWKSKLPTTPIPKSITNLLRLSVKPNAFWSPTAPPFTCFQVIYCCREFKLQDNPNTVLFFLEKDLKTNHKMNLLFTYTSNQASFLPREVVRSIPFSSRQMAEILNKFAVKPKSAKAEVMKNTIKHCEESGIKGEEKYCATSLESMVDFITLKLGKDVEALSTEVMKDTKQQEYTIMQGVKKVGDAKVVVCHKLKYVYALFNCHKIENTVAYTVSLKGADGSRVKAVSVCHRDTSRWNPQHLAFQVLKVKPGGVPICHFLYQSTIAWVPKQN